MDALLDVVKEALVSYVDTGALDLDTKFDSLDVDSLVLVELAVTLEMRLGFSVDGNDIREANTVRQLAALQAQRKMEEAPGT